MQRYDFHYLQKVTESEIDGAFDAVEQALDRMYTDFGLVGILTGASVDEASSPNLTVDVSAGVVSDQTGQRIRWSSTQSVDCSIDENNVSTSVTTPGNSKIIGIYAQFLRVNSDPRVDGEQNTVFFNSAESFQLNVVQGAEAVTPVAPALRGDQILLADITISFGTTQILNANIDIDTRREWAITTTGILPTNIRVGTIEDAVQELAARIDAANDADGVTYAGSGNWANGSPLAATDVEAALDEIVSSLADQTGAGDDGAGRIGADAQTSGSFSVAQADISAQLLEILGHLDTVNTFANSGNWHDGSAVSATDVEAAINEVKNDLADTASGNGGADRIGAVAQSSGSVAVTIGSIHDQIGELLAEINTHSIRPQARNIIPITDIMSSGYDLKDINRSSDTNLLGYIAIGDTGAAAEGRYSERTLGAWQAMNAFTASPTIMNSIAFHFGSTFQNNLVAVGGKGATGATVQVSTNSLGKTAWTEQTITGIGNANDEGVCILPDTYNNYVIVGFKNGTPGTGSILARATSGPTTWTIPTGIPAAGAAIYDIDIERDANGTPVSGGAIIAVGEDTSNNGLVLRSTDDGATWTDVSPSLTGPIYGITYDRVNSRWWYAEGGTTPSIGSSTDNGLTWGGGGVSLSTPSVAGCGIAADNNGVVLATFYSTTLTQFAYMYDGSTWEAFSIGYGSVWNRFSKVRYLGVMRSTFPAPNRWVLVNGDGGRDAYISQSLNGTEK